MKKLSHPVVRVQVKAIVCWCVAVCGVGCFGVCAALACAAVLDDCHFTS